MKWTKLGRVFRPDGRLAWMRTHASNPIAEPLGGSLFRVYFSARDAKNRSSVGFAEIDLERPSKILKLSSKPVLSPGTPGHFDDSGVVASCLCTAGRGKTYLYYMGWNLAVTVPWRNSVGLASGRPPRFEKVSEAPVLDRGPKDPFSLSYPWVLRDGGRFRMWYGSNLAWGPKETDMDHVIKYAESRDGVAWKAAGGVAMGLARGEFAVSRPCVLKERGRYRMWYCRRGARYRIGYAESKDGRRWRRLDRDAGLEVSASGWDSEMVEYPFVFRHAGRLYMLYNGNGYGRTGFGLAVLEER